MYPQFIDLTRENLAQQHLCCIIRSKTQHPGVEAKRRWLAERLEEGHVFRKLDAKATVFIEFAPLETAWVPILGENYLYIYCLWVLGEAKGQGYGRSLMESCLSDAKRQGKSGICMLGSEKQKAWLSDQNFAKRYGFETVESTDNGYELLALSLDGIMPHFAPNARTMRIEEQGISIYYDDQCPYAVQQIPQLQQYAEEQEIPLHLHHVTTREQAKTMPCVFNNWAVFVNGKFETVNILDVRTIHRLWNKSLKG